VRQSAAIKEPIKKRSGDVQVDEISFPYGLQAIHPHSMMVVDTKGRPRKYILEIHKYNGFAMIKFYPHHLKKNAKRYQLRGEAGIGYQLHKKVVLDIIIECILLMRNHLAENPDEFVGYVGQTDDKDNVRNREQAQRCGIYNILTSSLFSDEEKYKLSSKKQFKEINLRLIRLNKSKQKGKLTKKQMENYNSFLSVFSKHPQLLYQLMTNVTRERILKNVQERIAN